MKSAPHPSLPPEPLAYLVALSSGFASREYRLAPGASIIGRDGSACDIVVAGVTVSRRHLRLVCDNQANVHLEDLKSTNGVFVNGQRIVGSIPLTEGDRIGLGTAATPHLRLQRQSSRQALQFHLAARDTWVIGRDPECDLALPFEPMVSGQHAMLRNDNGTLRILDNHSLNGTWLNGASVRQAALAADDTVIIGSTRFHFHLTDAGGLAGSQQECGQAIRLEGVNLSRQVPLGDGKVRVLLDDVTLAIAPGEFVGILGPSGAGKTTLLTALSGVNRPDKGTVLLNETTLDPAGPMFRNVIGYVPQDDILHPELHVKASLDYCARLRLSSDLSPPQRAAIVEGTIETLGLGQVRQTPIHQLSGGQRKRVSIGAELLIRPSLLFLDEPTSGLDPSTEDRLMRHFRRMAHEGTTVVITTHVLSNLALLDKVAIMAHGKLVFYGTPDEALVFFGKENVPLAQPSQIFGLLVGNDQADQQASHEQEQRAEMFRQLFRATPFYRENIEQSLSPPAKERLDRAQEGTPAPPASGCCPWLARWAAAGRRFLHEWSPAQSLRAWRILSRRHLHIRASASKRLLLFALIPLVLGLATLSQRTAGIENDETVRARKSTIETAVAQGGTPMAALLKHLLSPAGPQETRTAAELIYGLRHEGTANLPVPMSLLVMLVMTAAFSGTLIACLEISTERSIYVRERMSHLRIGPYLASKLPYCLAMAALQCLFYGAVCWLNPTLRQIAFVPVWLVLVAVAWSSVAIGLLLSAVDRSGGRLSVMLAIAVVLPQLLLSGGLGPDFFGGMSPPVRWFADLLPARWGLEMVCTAVFGGISCEGARWIPGFVQEVMGFDFGVSVYYSGVTALFLQTLAWLSLCAGFLAHHDRRPC